VECAGQLKFRRPPDFTVFYHTLPIVPAPTRSQPTFSPSSLPQPRAVFASELGLDSPFPNRALFAIKVGGRGWWGRWSRLHSLPSLTANILNPLRAPQGSRPQPDCNSFHVCRSPLRRRRVLVTVSCCHRILQTHGVWNEGCPDAHISLPVSPIPFSTATSPPLVSLWLSWQESRNQYSPQSELNHHSHRASSPAIKSEPHMELGRWQAPPHPALSPHLRSMAQEDGQYWIPKAQVCIGIQRCVYANSAQGLL
jgi:hypothetical protein